MRTQIMADQMQQLVDHAKAKIAAMPPEDTCDGYRMEDILIDEDMNWHAVRVEGPDWTFYTFRAFGRIMDVPWRQFGEMFPRTIYLGDI